MHLIKKITLLSLMVSLTSCASIYQNRYVTSRDTYYLKAYTIQPIQIPPGLSSSTIDQEYPIPDRTYPEAYKKVSLTPPDLMSTR